MIKFVKKIRSVNENENFFNFLVSIEQFENRSSKQFTELKNIEN